jgi:hypothetical protein
MRLVQFIDHDQSRRVAMVSEDGSALRVLRQVQSVYDLALEAGRRRLALAALVQDRLGMDSVSFDEIVSERRLLPPARSRRQRAHPDYRHRAFPSGQRRRARFDARQAQTG